MALLLAGGGAWLLARPHVERWTYRRVRERFPQLSFRRLSGVPGWEARLQGASWGGWLRARRMTLRWYPWSPLRVRQVEAQDFVLRLDAAPRTPPGGIESWELRRGKLGTEGWVVRVERLRLRLRPARGGWEFRLQGELQLSRPVRLQVREASARGLWTGSELRLRRLSVRGRWSRGGGVRADLRDLTLRRGGLREAMGLWEEVQRLLRRLPRGRSLLVLRMQGPWRRLRLQQRFIYRGGEGGGAQTAAP